MIDIGINICPICYNEIYEEASCILNVCSHKYCKECVHAFLMSSMEGQMNLACPLDKFSIQSIQTFDLQSRLMVRKTLTNFVMDMFVEWIINFNAVLYDNLKEVILFFYSLKSFFISFHEKITYFADVVSKGRKVDILKMHEEMNRYVQLKSFANIIIVLKDFYNVKRSVLKNGETDLRCFKRFLKSHWDSIKISDVMLTNAALTTHVDTSRISIELLLESLSMVTYVLHCNILDEEGSISQKFIDNVQLCCKDIRLKYDILSDNILLSKAVILQIASLPNFNLCTENSSTLCLICSEEIVEGTFSKSICSSCAERFMIYSPGSISKSTNDQPINFCYNQISCNHDEEIIFYTREYFEIVKETYSAQFQDYQELTYMLNDLLAYPKSLESYKHQLDDICHCLRIYTFTASKAIMVLSNKVIKMQYILSKFVCQHEELLEVYGNPTEYMGLVMIRPLMMMFRSELKLNASLYALSAGIHRDSNMTTFHSSLNLSLKIFSVCVQLVLNDITYSYRKIRKNSQYKCENEIMELEHVLIKYLEELHEKFLLE